MSTNQCECQTSTGRRCKNHKKYPIDHPRFCHIHRVCPTLFVEAQKPQLRGSKQHVDILPQVQKKIAPSLTTEQRLRREKQSEEMKHTKASDPQRIREIEESIKPEPFQVRIRTSGETMKRRGSRQFHFVIRPDLKLSPTSYINGIRFFPSDDETPMVHLLFEQPVTETTAIQAVERYFSEPMSRQYFNEVQASSAGVSTSTYDELIHDIHDQIPIKGDLIKKTTLLRFHLEDLKHLHYPTLVMMGLGES